MRLVETGQAPQNHLDGSSDLKTITFFKTLMAEMDAGHPFGIRSGAGTLEVPSPLLSLSRVSNQFGFVQRATGHDLSDMIQACPDKR